MAKNKKSGNKKNSSKPNKSSYDLAKAAANSSAANKSNQKQGGKRQGLFSYLKGVRQEFSKVVWPTREELTTDTIVVIATVVFFSLVFWLIDTGFLAALKGILGITLS